MIIIWVMAKYMETTWFHRILTESPDLLYAKPYTFAETDSDEVCEGTAYYIRYYDPDSPVFLPTVSCGMSTACNLCSSVTFEMRFAGEEDAEFCLYRRFKTEGMYAVNFVDVLKDTLEELKDYPIKFFDNVPGAAYDPKGKVLRLDFYDPTGAVGPFEFGVREISELRNLLVSVRIVKLEEKLLN